MRPPDPPSDRDRGDAGNGASELADFFEHAPVAMHWLSSDGIILRANRAEL
jgi:hypothetical protein